MPVSDKTARLAAEVLRSSGAVIGSTAGHFEELAQLYGLTDVAEQARKLRQSTAFLDTLAAQIERELHGLDA